MLKANDITFRVGNRELVSNVTMEFAPGKLHLIIGPNGAGKSTLIKLLARLTRPFSGSVEYQGVNIAAASEQDLARRRAVLSQAIEIAFPLTVREIIMMGRYPHFSGRPTQSDEEIVDKMAELFDVTELFGRNYQTLSGGEQQRVNFARILAQIWSSQNDICRYLFLDEPLTFLDIRHQIDFMKKIRKFGTAGDIVTVGVVHDLNLAARFADQILLLDNGRLISAGPPAEVLTRESIDQVFGVAPTLLEDTKGNINLIFE